MKYYEIKYDERLYGRTMPSEEVILANSEFEAKVIFLYHHIKYPLALANSITIMYLCNIYDILKYYYQVKQSMINLNW